VPVEISPASTTRAFVEVRLLDVVTQSEFDAATAKLAPVLHPWTRLLVDATALSNAPDVLTMLLRAPCRAQWPTHVRQAAVVRQQAAAVARAWIRATGPGSAGTQAFASRESAVAWLEREFQTTTGGS
jgi:hypothetical protein